jgi:hypothetical protein
MKTKAFLTIAAFLLAISSYAQKFLSLTVGANFPMGTFSQKDAGSAKPGMTVDLSAAKLFYKQIGVVGSIRGQFNGLDTDAVRKNTFSTSATTGKYSSFMVMLGPYVQYYVNKELIIDFRIQGGYIRTSFPRLALNNGINTMELTADPASTLGGLVGFGLKKKLNNKFMYYFNADYTIATQTFDVENSRSSVTTTTDQGINSLSVKVGIAYKF